MALRPGPQSEPGLLSLSPAYPAWAFKLLSLSITQPEAARGQSELAGCTEYARYLSRFRFATVNWGVFMPFEACEA